MGAGKYFYCSKLVTSGGKKIADNCDTNNNSTLKITISHYILKYKDGFNPISTFQPTFYESIGGKQFRVYYVSNIMRINFNITASEGDGISSYKYEIKKLDKNNNGVNYKTSGEIPVDGKEIQDTIEMDAKNYSNGKYKVIIWAYSYDNAKTYKESLNIVIDKKKPKCKISMSGTRGNSVIGHDGYYWYKNDSLYAKINLTDENIYKYKLDKSNIYSNKNDLKDVNKLEEQLYLITDNLYGVKMYGYAIDKAGNIGKCETDELYYDKNPPSCNIDSTGTTGNNNWYIDDDVELTMKVDPNNLEEKESGLYRWGLSNTNEKTCYNTICNEALNKTLKTTITDETTDKGTLRYGIVEDNAGNVGICEKIIYLDKTAPICSVSGGSEDLTNQTVEIKAICEDNSSGCIEKEYSTIYNEHIKADGIAGAWGVNIEGSVTDKAGHETKCPYDQTVRIDKVAPTCDIESKCRGGYDGVGNDGWCIKKKTNLDVSSSHSDNNEKYGGYVISICTDNDSGCAEQAKLTTSGATENVDNELISKYKHVINGNINKYYYKRNVYAQGKSNVSWTIYDKAGNKTICNNQNIKVDYTEPEVSIDKFNDKTNYSNGFKK